VKSNGRYDHGADYGYGSRNSWHPVEG